MVNSNRTALYDYGKVKNMKKYGTSQPPLIPFDDYDIPTALLSGSLDHMADPTDVQWISERLGEKGYVKRNETSRPL